MLGTIINAGAVIAGSILGLLLNRKLPEKVTNTAFSGIGVFTIFLGVSMAMKTQNYLILVFSIVLGSIIGELIDLEKLIERFGEKLKERYGKSNDKFTEGMITAFLLFCMGSMTIMGAIEEGLGNKPNLLLAKSLLDGFASIALTSAFGIGVMFSIIPLLIYQGGLTMLSRVMGDYFNQLIIDEVTAAGGLILIAMGIKIMNVKEVSVLNMLPALIFSALLSYLFL